MNSKVIKRMMDFDLLVKIPGRKNALGETSYKELQMKCYLKESLKSIYDSLGKEVTSSVQLYVTGEDGLSIPNNALLSIGHYEDVYDETTGEVIDVKFLPMYENRTIIKREIYYRPHRVADSGIFYLP